MSDHEDMPDWHYLEWTQDRIAAFWNFTAGWSPHHADYFTRQVGRGVVRFARTLIPMTQDVVDFGCGLGDLIECLLDQGVPCWGVDSSTKSVDSVNERFRERPGWKGAILAEQGRTPLSDGSVSTLFFIETIEHLPPQIVPEVLAEVRRLLAPESGHLFLTTPHNELLARNQVFCPACHSVFHRYQHVATFNRQTLTEIMEAAGFMTLACNTTDFGHYINDVPRPRPKSWLDVSVRDVLRLGRRLVAGLKAKSDEEQAPAVVGPHLYWLGTVRPARQDLPK